MATTATTTATRPNTRRVNAIKAALALPKAKRRQEELRAAGAADALLAMDRELEKLVIRSMDQRAALVKKHGDNQDFTPSWVRGALARHQQNEDALEVARSALHSRGHAFARKASALRKSLRAS